jgi:hypothetical protein
MRKKHEEYWSVSLPKEHEALQALDSYCKEWGGLSRPEATRRLLIEWSRIQRVQPISAWSPTSSPPSMESVVLERSSRTTGTMNKPPIAPASARAANRVLDE